MKALRLIIFFSLLISNLVFSAEISDFHDVVVQEVISSYSEGLDDDYAFMSEDDIWGLEFAKNDSNTCIEVITGFAHIPTERGSAVFQFWVCITQPKLNYFEAEVIDDSMITEFD